MAFGVTERLVPEWEREYSETVLAFMKSRPTRAQIREFAGDMLKAYPELSAQAKWRWQELAAGRHVVPGREGKVADDSLPRDAKGSGA